MSLSPNTVAPPGAGVDIERIADERLLRAIADQSRDILVVLRPDSTITYQSQQAERLLGYPREYMIGLQAFSLLHPEDAPDIQQRLALIAADPGRSGQFRAEFRLRHQDGSWHWFEAMATNLLTDPTVGGILINARDITDRKQAELQLKRAEEALRQSELRYRTVAEFTPGFVQELELHPDGRARVTWASEGFEQILGFAPGKMTNVEEWLQLVHPAEREAVRARTRRILAGEQAEGELRIVDAHGAERWLLTVNRPVGNLPDGGVTVIGVVYDITKRKRAELALLSSNARLSAIQQVALDCIIVMDGQGRIVDFNPAAERTFGRQRDQVVGQLLHETLMPPRFREAHVAGLERYLATGEHRVFGRRIELVGMRVDGTEFPLELEVSPLQLAGQTLFTAYLRDTTERKLFEQRLNANEALLRAVTESVPDWLFMLDANLRVQFANRAVLGSTPAELVGRDALDFFPEDEREATRAVYRRVLESGEPRVHESRAPTFGEVRWFENRVGPVFDEGRIVGLTVACSEMTERRRSEEVLRTQAQILDTMREGVLLLDSGRVIKVVNSAMARLAGYNPDELVGRAGRVLSRRTAAEYSAIESDLGRRIDSEGFCEIEFECVRKDGSSFMAVAVITPIDIAGERHVLAVVEDVTQRRSLEREIIEIANREQRRIGSDLHDGLGQELTGIALMLRGLSARLRKEGGPGAVEAEEIVALVNKSIESTRQLARGLSPVTIERGGLPFALRSLAARASDMYGCHVRFRSKIWPQLALEASTCNHLYRIAQEAITNSVRHGHATDVTIDLHANGEDVKLTVSDNGRGLQPGIDLAQGMGLRIMRYRANIVGGTVDIAAAPVGGVLVTVSCRQPLSVEVQPRGAAS